MALKNPAFILLFIVLLSLAPSVPSAAQNPTPTSTPVVTATPPPVFPLAAGSSIEGNINNTVPSVRYRFDANANDSVTISMDATSGDLDPFLLLYQSDGTGVDQNDDAQSGVRNSQIAITLNQTGTYIVEATRFQQAEGSSTGTFRLTLSIAGSETGSASADPLSVPPNFGVAFTIIAYQQSGAGTLTDASQKQYFALGGHQGDLVRAIMSNTGGDLSPQLRILDRNVEDISHESQTGAGESVAYATLPETGWYLLEAGARSGAGSFSLYVDRPAAAVIQVGQAVNGQFSPGQPSVSYILNARIGDLISATLFSTGASSGVSPQLNLLDLSFQTIATTSGDRFASLRATIPRSGVYILQANNRRTDTSGGFNLRLATSLPMDMTRLNVQPASYNNQYKGTLNDAAPIVYYRFSGKTGELVTAEMSATNGSLDPYLILMDADLNELTSNDNVNNTPNSRIAQFALPKDGDYFLLATRSGLAAGRTSGDYNLALTAGAIALSPGNVTVTVTWASNVDLNLFVRDPDGRTVSWSNPQVASGGRLQIDSNTNCITPSAQPVEHIYWPGAAPVSGDYEVWVWYENGCGSSDPTPFKLDISVNGIALPEMSQTLQLGQRFETAIRVADNGQGFSLDSGDITTPTPQQRASEGGDIPIRYGQALTGTLNDDIFALFYQFTGQQGDQISIRVETLTGSLDPIVVLRDGDDNNLAQNDDADSSTKNSYLTYTLPATGKYIIAVTRFGVRDGTTSGDFRLTLEKANP